jgi:hypothetical protein
MCVMCTAAAVQVGVMCTAAAVQVGVWICSCALGCMQQQTGEH